MLCEIMVLFIITITINPSSSDDNISGGNSRSMSSDNNEKISLQNPNFTY